MTAFRQAMRWNGTKWVPFVGQHYIIPGSPPSIVIRRRQMYKPGLYGKNWREMFVDPTLEAIPVVIPSGFPTEASVGWQAGVSPPSSLSEYPTPGSVPGVLNLTTVQTYTGRKFQTANAKPGSAGSLFSHCQMVGAQIPGAVAVTGSGQAEFAFCTIGGDPYFASTGVGINVGGTAAGVWFHDCLVMFMGDLCHPQGPCLIEGCYFGPMVQTGLEATGGTHNNSFQNFSTGGANGPINIRNNTILAYVQNGHFLNDAIWKLTGPVRGGAAAANAVRFTGNFCSGGGGSGSLSPGGTQGMIIRGNVWDFWTGPNGRRQPRTAQYIFQPPLGSTTYHIGDSTAGAAAGSVIEKAASWDESDYNPLYIYWVQDNVAADTNAALGIDDAKRAVSAW